MDKEIVVFCTTPETNLARKIAETLIQEELAACCNILPKIESIYSWQGELHQDNESLLIIKTTSGKYPELEARIKSLHSYQVPEIIALDIEKGNAEYIKWLHQVVNDE